MMRQVEYIEALRERYIVMGDDEVPEQSDAKNLSIEIQTLSLCMSLGRWPRIMACFCDSDEPKDTSQRWTVDGIL